MAMTFVLGEKGKKMAQLTWDELKDNLRQKFPTVFITAEQLSECLQELDAVPVVRCKDCRWFENDGYHTNCQIMRFCVEAKDYCSRGERREDGKI